MINSLSSFDGILSYILKLSLQTSSKSKSEPRKRHRMTPEEERLLKKYWREDNYWPEDVISEIKTQTSLTKIQIYKWGYLIRCKKSCPKGIKDKEMEEGMFKMLDMEQFDYNKKVAILCKDKNVDSKTSKSEIDSALEYSNGSS